MAWRIGLLVRKAGPFAQCAFHGAQIREIQGLNPSDLRHALLSRLPEQQVTRLDLERSTNLLRDRRLPLHRYVFTASRIRQQMDEQVKSAAFERPRTNLRHPAYEGVRWNRVRLRVDDDVEVVLGTVVDAMSRPREAAMRPREPWTRRRSGA